VEKVPFLLGFKVSGFQCSEVRSKVRMAPRRHMARSYCELACLAESQDSGSTHLPQHGIIPSIRDSRFDVPAEMGGNLRRFQHRRGTGTTQSGRVPNPTKVCRMSRTKFSLLNCLLEVLAHEVNATMTWNLQRWNLETFSSQVSSLPVSSVGLSWEFLVLQM